MNIHKASEKELEQHKRILEAKLLAKEASMYEVYELGSIKAKLRHIQTFRDTSSTNMKEEVNFVTMVDLGPTIGWEHCRVKATCESSGAVIDSVIDQYEKDHKSTLPPSTLEDLEEQAVAACENGVLKDSPDAED